MEDNCEEINDRSRANAIINFLKSEDNLNTYKNVDQVVEEIKTFELQPEAQGKIGKKRSSRGTPKLDNKVIDPLVEKYDIKEFVYLLAKLKISESTENLPKGAIHGNNFNPDDRIYINLLARAYWLKERPNRLCSFLSKYLNNQALDTSTHNSASPSSKKAFLINK